MSQEQAQSISNAEQEDTVTLADSHGTAGQQAAAHQGEEEEHIHLPGPSYWPILLAAGMAFTMVGLMIDISLAAAGLLLSFIFGIGWAMNWGLESHQEAHVE
ncbi:MAG TPA: cytochrome c oxidase subunit 4 [Ktedonobacterales bacterium]|nr:cytochrome c oxidase subunit 4 [Ktedonobacterales bacterium]